MTEAHRQKAKAGGNAGRELGHLAIMASAGSGKTTRLAHRYIRLLADQDRQITPGKICAMTFTRKAAGEIFDKIANELSHGAAGKKTPTADISQDEFLKLLRTFLDNLHRVNIGTMDSFIVRVAKAFPLELGIPMDFQVTDAEGAAASENRKAVLAALLTPSAVRQSVQKSFLEAFKRATFGLEEKNFGDVLDRFISSYHTKYRLCPDPAKWGDEKKIWPGKGRPWKFKPVNLDDCTKAAITWIDSRSSGADKDYGKFLDALKDVVVALGKYDPTTPWDTTFDGTIGSRVLEQLLDSGAANLIIKSGRKDYEIDREAAAAIEKMVLNVVAVEIDRSIRRTQGIHELLSHYDTAYDQISRQTGRFSFADLQYLLAFGDRSGNGPHISRTSGADGKLYIDYRMDSRLDHWLLDEFQDTSDMQWMIFANLINELVQGSPDGTDKSFFYVGDVKQAIYRWRGGDQDLFLGIYDNFNQNREVIKLETLSHTYRCSPAVIDAVNKVFSQLPQENLPTDAVEKWAEVWQSHETHKKDLPGYVALLEPPDLKENSGIEGRFELVADLLNDIQPLKRGLGVGILVRTNGTGSKMASVLRDKCPGMNFVHEGSSGIVTNELAQALISLVKLAAHPGDEFAWKHIRMTPLAELLAEKQIDRDNISDHLLLEIETGGFQPFISNWGGALSNLVLAKLAAQKVDPEKTARIQKYGGECLTRLVNASAEFDAAGSRSCNGFITFINEYSIHEQASHSSVRIMTVHQAKGLEFDIVILPELQDGKMNMVKAEPPDLICAGKSFSPDWILKAPKKIALEHDPELGRQVEKANVDNCFDLLCLVYVAMTRARHALYIITSHQKSENSVTFRPSRFVKQQLTGEAEPEAEPNIEIGGRPYVRLYPSTPGGEEWYTGKWKIKEEERPGEEAGGKPALKTVSTRTILKRSEPSKQESFERSAASLFDAERRDVLDFGSAIHELFEQIEWLDEHTDVEKIIREWTPSADCRDEVHRDVCTQFRNTMKSAEIRKALSKPVGKAEVKLEWNFDIILDDKWISGAFDRVIITKDGKGRPVGAVIMDYKSNRIEPSDFHLRRITETYRGQMETYRRALSAILTLPESKIALQLLLTRIQKIVTIESACFQGQT